MLLGAMSRGWSCQLGEGVPDVLALALAIVWDFAPVMTNPFADSAKASSALQPLLMMMPDQGPEFALPCCASTDRLKLDKR